MKEKRRLRRIQARKWEKSEEESEWNLIHIEEDRELKIPGHGYHI